MTGKGDIISQVDDFIELLKNTSEYIDYSRQKDLLDREPELKERVEVFRREIFTLQHDSDSEDAYEKIENLERQNKDFLSEPLVHDFLDAESSFCRLMQTIIDKVMDNIDF